MFDGGLTVDAAMSALLSQPGFIGLDRSGQRLRELYRAESLKFNAMRISPFAFAVYSGNILLVKEACDYGIAPDLRGSETPFKVGYASLAVLGSQRVPAFPPLNCLRYLETLQFIFDEGAPVDSEDVMGFTALHHATASPKATEAMTRCLLGNGANVNHRNRFGEISLLGCMQLDLVPIIKILMESGADLDLPDADGCTVRQHYLYCGPRVIAVVASCIRQRLGIVAPRAEKRCDACGAREVKLKICSRCKVARYCSVKCQAQEWKEHKRLCTPFMPGNTVLIKPFYEQFGCTVPVSDFSRRLFGYPTHASSFSERLTRTSHIPRNLRRGPKVLVVKVQVPPQSGGEHPDLLIYTKRRNFACTVRRRDCVEGYDRISAVVRLDGSGGVKAYFMAELESPEKLVIKFCDILAEQPW